MGEMAHRLPTLEEELNRKAWETLDDLLRRHDQGKITQAQFDLALDVLFNALSGLVDREFVKVLSGTAEVFKHRDGSYSIRELLVSPTGELAMVEREVGEEGFTIKMGLSGGAWSRVVKKSFNEALAPSKAAQEGMARVVDQLIERGFKRLR